MITDEMVERGVVAIYPNGPDAWRALLTWAAKTAATVESGSPGWRSAQIRGEKPFEEARARVEFWRSTVRTCLEAAMGVTHEQAAGPDHPLPARGRPRSAAAEPGE